MPGRFTDAQRVQPPSHCKTLPAWLQRTHRSPVTNDLGTPSEPAHTLRRSTDSAICSAWAGARLDCSSRCVSAGVLVPADTGLGALSRRERRNKTAGRPALAPACARVMSRHVRKRAGMGFSCVRGLELTAPGMHAGTSGDIESHPGQAVSAPPGLPGGIREHADTSAPVSRRVPRPAPASRD